MRKMVKALLTVAAGTVMAAMMSAAAFAGADNNSLVVAIQSEPSGLDPHMVTDKAAQYAIENMYNTLFSYTATYGEIEPSLVASYEVSEDSLVYTMTLCDGITFHSGNAMTSEDVKFSLERIKESGVRASQMSKIASIETPDEKTVVITMESAYAPFLSYLANPLNAIVEKSVVEANDGDLTNVDAGSGPFALTAWNVGTNLEMAAFDGYFEDGKPGTDSLELRPIADETSRATALRNGEVDMVFDATDMEVAVLQNADGVVLETVPGTFWEYLGMNCETEALSNPLVREAIAYAIDRNAINMAVKMGHATVLTEANIPADHEYFGGDAIYTERNVEKAKELLAEAGVEEGSINLKFTVGADWQYQVDAATMIKQQIAEIGINCELSAMESGVYFDGLNSGDFDLTVCGWSGFVDADEFLYDLFTSAGAYNQQNYANADVDALLEEGRVTTDPAARKEIYAKAEKIIAEEAPMAFLYMNSYTVASRDNVKGFTVQATGTSVFLKDVTFEG